MTTNDLAPLDQTNEPISAADLLTADAAKQLTDTIRQGAESVWQLIGAAYQGRAWTALGYESWDAYVDGEFGGAPLALPREKRKEAVASLKAQGMSLRAIAAATDTSPQTVANDLAAAEAEAGVQKLDTSVLTEEQHVRLDELQTKEASDDFLSDEEFAELQELRNITAVDAELVDEPTPVATVTGIDGKSYKQDKTPKTPKEPKPVKPENSPQAKDAQRIAKYLRTAQELMNDLQTSKDYIDAPKDVRVAVDEALATAVVDLLEELDIRVPAKWMKLVS